MLGTPSSEAATLGERLRRLRRMRRLTLQEVAAAVEISPSFLSMVERGQADISLSRFTRLAGFYGIRASELMLEDPDRHAPRVGGVEEGVEIERGGGIRYRLLPNSPAALQLIHIRFEPSSAMRDVLAHDGEDFCFVVRGAVTLLYGDREIVMQESQCVTYNAGVPHAFRNDGGVVAELIGLTTKPYW
jgi:transcriptional regulator with XRE-family HTH domain